MSVIKVKLRAMRDDSYSITVKAGLFAELPGIVAKKWRKVAKWAIVTDTNVEALYGDKLLKALKKSGLDAGMVSFPAGERFKSRHTVADIEDLLFANKLGRDGAIIALGGGVTGDIAGFVAATYMRGIPFVQIPTTLLATVDSSVGGKTGIDTPAGKNLVGAFHQPKAVFIDPNLLKSLKINEILNGVAESVKHAVIRDAALFKYLENNVEKLLELDSAVLSKVIAKNCSIKASVVEKDERESALRQILNYGHTVGHALEKLSEYRLSHGEAVAIGMAVEGKLAHLLGIFPQADLERQNALLREFGLPIAIPGKIDAKKLVDAMTGDKKNRGGKIKMALPEKTGKMSKGGGDWALSPEVSSILAALRD